MKRYLLLAVIFSSPAHAQLSVTDIGTHVIGQLGLTNQATEIAKWGQQLQAMQQQYQQLQATYNVLSHVTDINGVSSILGGVTRSYMPASSSVPGLMGGTGGLWSSAGALLNQDRLFQSSNNDPYQQEMQRHEEVTANAKAMAAAGIQDAQQSIANLAALKARLEVGPPVLQRALYWIVMHRGPTAQAFLNNIPF